METRSETRAGETVKELAADLGFALCGIAEARPTDYSDELRGWLEAGKHGEMDWLARNVELREDPRALLPGARSVVCVADDLGGGGGERETRSSKLEARDPKPEGERPETEAQQPPAAIRDPKSRISNRESGSGEPGRPGRIARYAQFSDYHKVLKKRLFRLADALRQRWPGHEHKVCVDTAPILEREHARRAGLGWVGKHTLLLNRRLGSHLLLGEIVTTLPLPADEPETDHCGSCTRCIDACPTGCITPYSVDATRCLSYLTIEHRSAIDPGFHEAIGDWLFGCDVCQEVCPFVNKAHTAGAGGGANARKSGGGGGAEAYERHPATRDVLEVLGWDEDDRRAAFTNSAMKRAKLPQMKRNALIVAGNRLREGADPPLRQRIEAIAADPDEPEIVRRTANDVLRRLESA